MAFIVEDGSGVEDATAYVAVAFVDEYHTDRGNVGWAGANDVKQQAIVKATDYIDKRFGKRFRGLRKSRQQALEWPRINAFDDDGFLLIGSDDIPRALQKACAEYALRALVLTQLAPDPALPFVTRDAIDSGVAQNQSVGEVTEKSVKVGQVEVSKTYKSLSENSSKMTQNTAVGAVPGLYIPAYPEADLLLNELVVSLTSREIVRA